VAVPHTSIFTLHLDTIEEMIQMTPSKLVHGLHVPIRDPEKWLTGATIVDGLPAYQYSRIKACLELLAKQKRTLRTYVDGGAHIGTWVIHVAKHARCVHAFEPVQANYDCLVKNINQHCMAYDVNVHPYALNDVNDTVWMVDGGKSWSWSINQDGNIPVTGVALDSYGLYDVDLIKLDVEGHEFAALLGARATLNRCNPIVVIEEKHDPEERASTFLTSIDYACVAQMKNDKIFTRVRK
jgi:FkbM family methyltransferase